VGLRAETSNPGATFAALASVLQAGNITDDEVGDLA
jgi:hypothetical protein